MLDILRLFRNEIMRSFVLTKTLSIFSLPSILEVIRSGGMSSGIEFPQRLNDLDKGSSGQTGLSLGLSGLRVFEDPPGLHDKVRKSFVGNLLYKT